MRPATWTRFWVFMSGLFITLIGYAMASSMPGEPGTGEVILFGLGAMIVAMLREC